MKQAVRSVGVMSFARISGLLYTILGVVLIPFILMATAFAPSKGRGGMPFGGGMIFALAAPFLYGLLGFVFGAIMAALYNVVAGWIGGVELELEVAAAQPTPQAASPEPARP
jgi:hypothetical protein